MINSMNSFFFRATLLLLVLTTFALTSSPVYATQNRDMHNTAAMSQEMSHEHIRDCAAACGVMDRSESRKLNVNQSRKEKEKLFDNPPVVEQDPASIYLSYKFRTVFMAQKNNSYLRYALLRL